MLHEKLKKRIHRTDFLTWNSNPMVRAYDLISSRDNSTECSFSMPSKWYSSGPVPSNQNGKYNVKRTETPDMKPWNQNQTIAKTPKHHTTPHHTTTTDIPTLIHMAPGLSSFQIKSK